MDQVRCCGCGASLARGAISCGECGALQGSPGPVRLAATGLPDTDSMDWFTQAGEWVRSDGRSPQTRWLALIGGSLLIILLCSLAYGAWVGHAASESEPDVASGLASGDKPNAQDQAEGTTRRSVDGATPVAAPPKAANECVQAHACARAMLDAVMPWRPAVIWAAAANLEQYALVPPGDSKKARVLNQQAMQIMYRGDEARAVAVFERARAAQPGDAQVTSNLGWALFRAGRLAEAESTLLMALEMEPQSPAIWIRLAVTLDHQDRTDDALKALLLAYAFSTQKDQMVDYFIAKSQSTEFTSQTRSLFARALEMLTTQGKDLDRFRG